MRRDGGLILLWVGEKKYPGSLNFGSKETQTTNIVLRRQKRRGGTAAMSLVKWKVPRREEIHASTRTFISLTLQEKGVFSIWGGWSKRKKARFNQVKEGDVGESRCGKGSAPARGGEKTAKRGRARLNPFFPAQETRSGRSP